MKADVALYSFSVHLSFVYKKINNFCELILYSATLLNLVISSKCLHLEFSRSHINTIILSANKKTLY